MRLECWPLGLGRDSCGFRSVLATLGSYLVLVSCRYPEPWWPFWTTTHSSYANSIYSQLALGCSEQPRQSPAMINCDCVYHALPNTWSRVRTFVFVEAPREYHYPQEHQPRDSTCLTMPFMLQRVAGSLDSWALGVLAWVVSHYILPKINL